MKRAILAVLLAVSGAAFAEVAMWNGFKEPVLLASGGVGLKCGYNYQGRTYYKIFDLTYCPYQTDIVPN